jgi:DNA-directed RNA polymerase specialized sigma subunit
MALNESYQTWKTEPNPGNLNKVVEDLKPTITYSLSNLNALNDPVVKAEARVAAAKAVEGYDPTYGATLETHVSNQLKQLTRVARRQKSPIRVPERQQLEAYHINRTEREFADKHGREPDLDELADAAGFSAKKINRIKNRSVGVVSEGTFGGNIEERPDYAEDAVDYIYKDSDARDRKIIEHKLGYGGKPEMSSQEIAVMLDIHPAQVSRRAAKILMRVNEQIEAMEAIN